MALVLLKQLDPQRTGLVGFSADGRRTAALSIYARDKGEVPILFQALKLKLQAELKSGA